MNWSARQRLMQADPASSMRVWSIQHVDAWKAAQQRGWLTGDHEWSCMRAIDEEHAAAQFIRAYAWMRGEMAARIPDFSGDLPVWCWPRRPNPRNYPLDEACIRITALVPRHRILPSGFSEWHSVLNDAPFVAEREWDAWDRGDRTISIEQTWQGVLDLSPRTGERADWMGQPDHVQLCVDRLYLDEVVSTRLMQPRKRKRP